MKSRISLCLVVSALLLSTNIFGQTEQPAPGSQEEPKPISYGEEAPETSFKDKMFFGGSLGLQFGSYTYVDVSPLIGYKITERLQAGVGFTYIYYKVKQSTYYDPYETSTYGGRVFGRYYFLENFFAHSEFEILNMEVPSNFNPVNNYYTDMKRDNITSVMIGGGFAQPIGSNAAILLMALWNLTEEEFSPYQNPIFRIGISAGF